jgi:hypothetical protein
MREVRRGGGEGGEGEGVSDYNAVTEAHKLYPPEEGEYRGQDRNARERDAFILGAGWQAGRLLEVVGNQITKSEKGIIGAQTRITEGLAVDRAAMLELAEHNAEAVAYRYIRALLMQELRPE